MNDNAKHHLTFLASGAEMVSRHARALPSRMPFKTAAQDELEDAERELEAALHKVRIAMAEYDAKPLDAELCGRCGGSGWLDAIGPKSDGSYITSRPCPRCDRKPLETI